MDELITKGSIQELLSEIAASRRDLREMSEAHTPQLHGERYLTGDEVQQRFSICKKTLQTYRDRGVIPHVSIGGKFLYKESDLLRIINDNYHHARKEWP